jgi:hypothetical protein
LDTLQQKSDSLSSFLDRFHTLSVRFGGSVVQTCRAIDMSRSLFYEIRDGRRHLTEKAWRKLEAAERAAFGVGDHAPVQPRPPPSSPAPPGLAGLHDLLQTLIPLLTDLQTHLKTLLDTPPPEDP